LERARKAQLAAEAAAFAARRKLAALKRAQKERLAEERRKCAGKCDREFPVLVGPKHVPAKETRSVVVIGDKAANKKRWERVKTHKRLLWDPKGLKKARRHLKRYHRSIVKNAKKHKRIVEAPLVSYPPAP